jgi:hypothetical protein
MLGWVGQMAIYIIFAVLCDIYAEEVAFCTTIQQVKWGIIA